MNQSFYPLAMDNWGQEEIAAANKVLDSKLLTMGKTVEEFERVVASKFGSKHAVMVNSGSSANLLMLAAMRVYTSAKIENPKNIVVPAVSWSTTFTPAYYLNYELRFVDIDIESFGIATQLVESAIDENTVAILAVNILGSACDLWKLQEIASKHGIWLLEDNCESMGASLKGRHTGTFGRMASHSSFYSHHINTMEGGWITTDDSDLLQILKSLRAHGWTRSLPDDSPLRPQKKIEEFNTQFEFILPGLNFRPLEIEAAIGLVQLKKFDEMLGTRQRNAKIFMDLFQKLNGVRTQIPLGESSWFAFALIFESTKIRNQVAKLLRDNLIECRPIIAGNFTRQRALDYLNFKVCSELTNSNTLHDCGLYIGNHPTDLSNELIFTHKLLSQFDFQ